MGYSKEMYITQVRLFKRGYYMINGNENEAENEK